jgi:hypothetical protein
MRGMFPELPPKTQKATQHKATKTSHTPPRAMALYHLSPCTCDANYLRGYSAVWRRCLRAQVHQTSRQKRATPATCQSKHRMKNATSPHSQTVSTNTAEVIGGALSQREHRDKNMMAFVKPHLNNKSISNRIRNSIHKSA